MRPNEPPRDQRLSQVMRGAVTLRFHAGRPRPSGGGWSFERHLSQVNINSSPSDYLHIVEGMRRESEGLSITVQADRPIHSEGKGSGGCVVLGDRKLVFLPARLGMIVVSTKPAADRGGRHQ